jgi:dihydropteroate synthase
MATRIFNLSWRQFRLELGRQTCIMGVINVTPDSFSDGGKFFKTDDAVAQGLTLFEEGADIIDIGGESTRPYSDPLPADEESARVLPVIEKLAPRISAPISIDTTKAVVARRALEAGAAMINDISALRMDPGLAAVASEYKVPLVLMHMKGTPKDMQVSPRYDDLLGEIKAFLNDAVERAVKGGVPKNKLIIDPGIGFGKMFEHNLTLINRLSEFETLGRPLLVGPSRKAFIRNLVKDKDASDIDPQVPLVETGTQAAVAAAILNGAHIVRVHNVANTLATVKIVDAIRNASY